MSWVGRCFTLTDSEEWPFYPCFMAFTAIDDKKGTRSLHLGRLDEDCVRISSVMRVTAKFGSET